MRLALLGPANSIHTQRWSRSLSARGHDVTLFTQHAGPASFESDGGAVRVLPFRGISGYTLNALPLRQYLAALKPDILHAHYASGYGTLATLTNYRPRILSVWGSDAFDFPAHSALKRSLLRHNLNSASFVAATSHALAERVAMLAPRIPAAHITPFGVDCRQFQPLSSRDDGTIVIGTVKTLAATYGIDLLIQAFSALITDPILQADGLASRLRLLIVGDGPEHATLTTLAQALGVSAVTTFAGAVPHRDVPSWLNQLDIYVAASRQESFGVAVLEASACGLPVVVSATGGLPEVVRSGETGFIIPVGDACALAAQLKRLVLDAGLRNELGARGRAFVRECYDWERSVDVMEQLYCDAVRRIS